LGTGDIILPIFIAQKPTGMKNLFVGILGAFLTHNIAAQDDYTLKMTVKTEGLPAEYAAYSEQEIITYVKGRKSKTEISSMMFSTTVYFDGKNLTSLSDIMGNKSGYTATKEEIDAHEPEDNGKPVIEYTGEKKMIAGYECTKAIATTTGKDSRKKQTVLWITDKIRYDKTHSRASGGGMANFGDLKGHPLGMEMTEDMQGTEMKIIMTTTEVSTKSLPDSVFVPNTEGYKMMTYQEFQDQMKAMRGGK
jgi:hypothetical protein